MAEIFIRRVDRNDKRTISPFEYSGVTIFTLEDTDRNLKQDMPLAGIKEIKVPGKTAIPYGRYEVGISYSNRFKKLMPIVFDVPGFSGIRIHPGNTEEDTDGCPLVGLSRSTDTVLQSRIAYSRFFEWLEKTLKTEKVYLNVVKG